MERQIQQQQQQQQQIQQPQQHQQHVLFEFSPFDSREEIDERTQRSYQSLEQMIAGKSAKECHDLYLKHIATNSPRNIEDLTMGLLVAILLEPDGQQSKYYRDVVTFSKDSLNLFSTYLNMLIIERISKLKDHSINQVFWITHQFMKANINSAENVCINLVRQTAGGDLSAKNLKLAENLLELVSENRSWLINSTTFLVPTIIYTFMRLISDHMAPAQNTLRQKEVEFVIGLIRERFLDCLQIGKDFLRLLYHVVKIPEFEKLWNDIFNEPRSLHPSFQSSIQLLSTRTPRRLFQYRLTFEMERKISFLATQVKFGNQKRYQDWFHKQYLSTPASLSLRCDLIRYICTIIHPTNEVLCSDIIPRWAIIGWLLSTCMTNTSATNSRLALFFDWLVYDSKMDNIMNIEPAILVMYHSIRNHPNVTVSLLDYLCRLPNIFLPKLNDHLKAGIKRSLQQILEKRVVPSLVPLLDNPKHDPTLRALIRENFIEFCAHPTMIIPNQTIDNGISHQPAIQQLNSTNAVIFNSTMSIRHNSNETDQDKSLSSSPSLTPSSSSSLASASSSSSSTTSLGTTPATSFMQSDKPSNISHDSNNPEVTKSHDQVITPTTIKIEEKRDHSGSQILLSPPQIIASSIASSPLTNTATPLNSSTINTAGATSVITTISKTSPVTEIASTVITSGITVNAIHNSTTATTINNNNNNTNNNDNNNININTNTIATTSTTTIINTNATATTTGVVNVGNDTNTNTCTGAGFTISASPNYNNVTNRDDNKAYIWNGTEISNSTPSIYNSNHDNIERTPNHSLNHGIINETFNNIAKDQHLNNFIDDDIAFSSKDDKSHLKIIYPFMVVQEIDFEETINFFDHPIKCILEDLNMEHNNEVRCNLMDKLISTVFDNSEQSNTSSMLKELGHCMAYLIVEDFSTRIFPSSSQDNKSLEESIASPLFVLCRSAFSSNRSNCPFKPMFLLSSVSKYFEATGFLVLYFLRVNAIVNGTGISNNYIDFCNAAKRKIPKCLHDDLIKALTYDSEMFCFLLPSIYGELAATGNFPITGNIDIIRLVVSAIDPINLQELICLCMTGTTKIINKEEVSSLIEASLNWESWEQYSLWKLISAQSVPVENYISLLPKLDSKSHAEAMACISLNLQKITEPTVNMLQQLIECDCKPNNSFISSILRYWSMKTDTKDLAKMISSLFDSRPTSPQVKRKGQTKLATKNPSSLSSRSEKILLHLDSIRQRAPKNKLLAQTEILDMISQMESLCNESQRKRFADLFANRPKTSKKQKKMEKELMA